MRNFERFVMCALCGFLLVFLSTVFIPDARDARKLMAVYSFFMMGLYIIRGWHFKQPYDKIEIIGCGLIGLLFLSGF